MPGEWGDAKLPTTPSKPNNAFVEVALEMALEDFRRAPDREVVHDPGLGQRKASHVAAQAQQLRDRADLRPTLGGARSSHFLSKPNHRFKFGDVAVVSLGIGFHVTSDLLAR